ncbi:uncharacterized protein DEA37_0012666, partial [Paragonimus westermani]
MSIGFLLPSPDHAVIWRGPRKNTLIRQLLTDVCWTDDNDTMDFLLIDTPPGTSDEHLSVVQYLQAAGCLDGAIIVTTPQEVALSDVRKRKRAVRKGTIGAIRRGDVTIWRCDVCGRECGGRLELVDHQRAHSTSSAKRRQVRDAQ